MEKKYQLWVSQYIGCQTGLELGCVDWEMEMQSEYLRVGRVCHAGFRSA
jgi:hypothetical protein